MSRMTAGYGAVDHGIECPLFAIRQNKYKRRADADGHPVYPHLRLGDVDVDDIREPDDARARVTEDADILGEAMLADVGASLDGRTPKQPGGTKRPQRTRHQHCRGMHDQSEGPEEQEAYEPCSDAHG